MPQCCTVLPSTLQLHPALLLLLFKWETPVSLLAVISTTHTGTCPWVPAERKKFSACCGCLFPSWRYPSTPPHLPPPGWRSSCTEGHVSKAAPLPCSCQGLNKSSGGLGPVSTSRLCCHGRLYLGFAHLTALSAGTLCSGKNYVNEVKQRVLCFAYLAKNYALRKNSAEVE